MHLYMIVETVLYMFYEAISEKFSYTVMPQVTNVFSWEKERIIEQ